jgi:hypothetical protein
MEIIDDFIPVRDSGLNFIEQLQNSASFECQKINRPYLTGISEIEKKIILMRPSCKCWNCPTCAARNARRWIARIINHVNHSDTENGWFMFTLTAHEKWRGDYASVKNLRQGWKKLYNRMRYTFGVSQYCKVWEMHADKTFHLHGLIDSVIAERWLKDNARQCGMGYQVDMHYVDNAGQVAGYIAKYFLKSEAEISANRQYPPNLRRIEVSRGWAGLLDLQADSDLNWLITKTRDGQLLLASSFECLGYIVLDFTKSLDK